MSTFGVHAPTDPTIGRMRAQRPAASLILPPLISWLMAAPIGLAGDWESSLGGASSHNGLVEFAGPSVPNVRWTRTIASQFGRPMAADGDRFFLPEGVFDGTDRISARSLASGKQLWSTVLPPHPSEPTAWPYVTGAKGGRVFATRAFNGGPARLYCLSAQDGSVLWESAATYEYFYTDGLAFAPDGDPILGDQHVLVRLAAGDGSVVWRTPRFGFADGSSAAVYGDHVYSWEMGATGPHVTAFDLGTGRRLYASPDLGPAGIVTQQVNLFVGPDGTVYAPRCQSNPATDFLVALRDTGATLDELWRSPIGYIPFAALAADAESGVYSVSREGRLQRLDPASGGVKSESAEVFWALEPMRLTVDASGRIFVAVGGALRAYDADWNLLWSLTLPGLQAGQPMLLDDGLLIADGAGLIVAVRDAPPREAGGPPASPGVAAVP